MTAGEGGIVITSDLKMFEHVQSQVNCGRASSTDEFQQRVLGSNYRMTDLQAALLIGQLDMWPELQAKRDAAAKRLSKALAAIDGVQPLPEQAERSRDRRFIITCSSTRAKLERRCFQCRSRSVRRRDRSRGCAVRWPILRARLS